MTTFRATNENKADIVIIILISASEVFINKDTQVSMIPHVTGVFPFGRWEIIASLYHSTRVRITR